MKDLTLEEYDIVLTAVCSTAVRYNKVSAKDKFDLLMSAYGKLVVKWHKLRVEADPTFSN